LCWNACRHSSDGLREQTEINPSLVSWDSLWGIHRNKRTTLLAPMAAKRTEMDSAELLRQLRLAIANQPEPVPEGFKTSAQWADEWKITSNAAGIVLCRAVKNGLVETKRFRVISGLRGVYPVTHYRLKQ
jgi:hypothetical protein